ncbi:MAG: protein-disulfide reductase DsbD domain-containing protein [Hyphomicrobiales bacterium]
MLAKKIYNNRVLERKSKTMLGTTKINKTLFILLGLLLFVSSTALKAQVLTPVSWKVSKEKLQDNEYKLIFEANIDPNWHLYSQDIPMSPPATVFAFEGIDENSKDEVRKGNGFELVGFVKEESKAIETYDQNFDMNLKYFADKAIFSQIVKITSDKPVTINANISFMSCDDSRCLPPDDESFSFDFNENNTTPAETSATPSGVVQPVKWKYTVKKVGDKEFDLYFDANIEGKYHLYTTEDSGIDGPLPTEFTFEPSKDYQLIGGIEATTKPEKEYEPIWEAEIKFFSHKAQFKQRIRLSSDTQFPVKGEIAYQVCNETSCIALYDDYEFFFDGKSGAQINAIAADNKPQEPTTITATSGSENETLWGFFITALLAGLAAILTPCVFPMIPMTVSFFMKDGKSNTKGIIQGLIYGFSIIAIYTIVGILVALLVGPEAANWLSTHWIPNIFFFLVFMIFAFSFFGMFEITLPSWVINKADQQANKGGFLGPFFMALTLVLVSFSCTGPLVGGILVESARGALLKPVIGMFGFSFAFALPFTLFAIFPKWLNNLPKSGGWLNSVKVVLGFIELALGLKFLSVADQTYHWGLLDREVYIALWVVIFGLMGIYLLGKLKFSHDSDVKFISVPRLLLSIITLSFVVYLIPGMWGAPLKALAGYLPPQASIDFDVNKIVRENIKTFGGGTPQISENTAECPTAKYADFLHLPSGLDGYFDYEQALECAKAQNKPLFIDFTGHGCVNCREMENKVWANPAVLRRLRNDFVIVALYVDDKTELPESQWYTSSYDNKVKKTIGKQNADFQIEKFNVNAQPYYVILNHDGQLLAKPKAYDLDVKNFVDFLDTGKKNFANKSVYTE